MEGEAGEVLGEGEEDEGEDEEEGRRGGEDEGNILIIVVLGGRPALQWAGLIHRLLPPTAILFPRETFVPLHVSPQ